MKRCLLCSRRQQHDVCPPCARSVGWLEPRDVSDRHVRRAVRALVAEALVGR